jgi:integrase
MTRQTLTEYLDWWLDDCPPALPQVLASRRWHVRRLIGPRIGGRRLVELRPNDVAGWLIGLYTSGLDPADAAGVLGTLTTALHDAARWRLIPANPAAPAPYPNLAVPAGSDVGPLLTESARHRQHALFALLLLGGLGLTETLDLRWEHLDLNAGTVRLRGRRDGLLGLPVTVVDALADHLELQTADGLPIGPAGPVFTSSSGMPLGANSVYRTLRSLRRAGVQYRPIGQLRRTLHRSGRAA